MNKRYKVCPLLMISQYDKDMCCLHLAEGMTYIWQQRENQELSRILESLADRKLMKRVHGGYAITLKGLLAVKVWRLHLFLFHHDDEFIDGQDQLAYKHQSNRADILRTLKLKAEVNQ